jgi:hypothetical protein
LRRNCLFVSIRGNNSAPSIASSSSSLSSTSTIERMTSTTVTRSYSAAQERPGQSVYISPADPVHGSSELFTPTTTTTPPSSALVQRSPGQTRLPLHHDADSTMTGSTDSGITVTAPPGVDVQHDAAGHTFTLTFPGLMSASPAVSAPTAATGQDHAQSKGQVGHSQGQGQGQGATPLVWQPSRTIDTPKTAPVTTSTVVDEAHQTTTSRPPQLARILQESKDLECPESPTSPSARTSSKYSGLWL